MNSIGDQNRKFTFVRDESTAKDFSNISSLKGSSFTSGIVKAVFKQYSTPTHSAPASSIRRKYKCN
jgi:hypothetical protein